MKKEKNKGITLIALIITIILLIILAAVSIRGVLNQDGIIDTAENAANKYGQASAKETLELARKTLELTLFEAQIKKSESGLTEAELDERIESVGVLLPKEDETSNIQQVIVEGYIFEIDRSVPKIIEYIGPANEIIITASITQTGDWQNPSATVKGSITRYGGTITSSSATASNISIPANFPKAGGNYEIAGITKDTDITINATDSTGKTISKVIQVKLIRDITPPTLSDVSANTSGMEITISAKASDSESGLKQINYTVTPNTITPNSGTLTSGGNLKLTATAVGEYTITFTATDNAGNITNPGVTVKATASDSISVADLKTEINSTNYKEYIGMKVNYKPDDTKAWRVFYYDADGYFGDGAGTIYLRRDTDTKLYVCLGNYVSYAPTDGGARMKKMNPAWASHSAGSSIDTKAEHGVAWLCDPDVWKSYKTEAASYAVGAASVEMWTRAYNSFYSTPEWVTRS